MIADERNYSHVKQKPKMNIHLTKVSDNVKTGPIPVTTSEASTCPEACPFKKSGCYADSGPLAMHWSKVTNKLRGDTLDILARQVKGFPAGQVWRHNQAGDLPGLSNAIDTDKLSQIVSANKGRRGFTYTHKPCEGDSNEATANRAAVRSANLEGFTINLSGNNLAHADRLMDLQAGPVVSVVPMDTAPTFETPAGRRGVVCPAQQRDDITCATCQLCSRANRSIIVGFLAHGTSKKKANAIASQ